MCNFSKILPYSNITRNPFSITRVSGKTSHVSNWFRPNSMAGIQRRGFRSKKTFRRAWITLQVFRLLFLQWVWQITYLTWSFSLMISRVVSLYKCMIYFPAGTPALCLLSTNCTFSQLYSLSKKRGSIFWTIFPYIDNDMPTEFSFYEKLSFLLNQITQDFIIFSCY